VIFGLALLWKHSSAIGDAQCCVEAQLLFEVMRYCFSISCTRVNTTLTLVNSFVDIRIETSKSTTRSPFSRVVIVQSTHRLFVPKHQGAAKRAADGPVVDAHDAAALGPRRRPGLVVGRLRSFVCGVYGSLMFIRSFGFIIIIYLLFVNRLFAR
jgi:hypothetical protein